MGRWRGLRALSGQVDHWLCERAPSCQPGFTVDAFALAVPRDSVAAGWALGRVSFGNCGEQWHAPYLLDNMRFKVSGDGVVSATWPLQLQQQEISFSVHTWDAAGKKRLARVTLCRWWHHHHRYHNQEACRGLTRDWVILPINCPENEWEPFPKKLVQLFSHAMSANGQPVEDPMEIITVTDQNDNQPVFTKQVFIGYIKENAKLGTPVMTVNAMDADDAINMNNVITGYSILGEEPKSVQQIFTIDLEKGIISVIGMRLDWETTPNYTLIIQAADQEGNGLTNTATTIVEVTDANDNAPVFDPTMYKGTVNENEVGVVVTQLHVTDGDMQGSLAWQAVYKIKSRDQDGDFSITTNPKNNDGILKTAKVGCAAGCLPASAAQLLSPATLGPGL
uniref:Cadherin domain-containing protein n=1 Tax=Strigops habroptila TaxID=2489341 RepID=A0A672TGY6_STRHB